MRGILKFRVCGNCPAREDPLNCHRAECPTRTVSLKRVETMNDMLIAHAFPWCRARLLHALGAAEEQGVLEYVLYELLGEEEDVTVSRIRSVLCDRRWAQGLGGFHGSE